MRHILPILILLLSIACSCGGQQAAPAGQDLPPAVTAAQSQHGLPALDTLRESSLAFSLEQDGNMATAQSPTAIVDGSELLLPSGSNFASWGIWSFDSGYDYPTMLNAVVNVPDGDEFWLAVSDYEDGRWQFSGPYGSGVAIELSSANRSPKHNLHVAVLAMEGSAVSVQKLVLATDNGWKVMDLGIPISSTALELISACMIGGRPAVAYVSEDGALSYLRASDPLAHDLNAWQDEPVGLIGGVGSFSDISLCSIDGKPAVALIRGTDQWNIYYACSSTEEAAPADWQINPNPLASGSNYSPNFSMADVGGHPAIAYVDTNEELAYIRASTGNGSTASDWSTPLILEVNDEPNEHVNRPQLMMDRGKPLVSYIGHSNEVFLRYSDSATGAKLSNWLPRSTVGLWNDGDWEDKAMFMHEGNLVFMLYADDSNNSSSFEPDFIHYYFRDTYEKQTGWEGKHEVAEIDGGSFHASLSGASINGMPAACYRSNYSPELTYSFSDPDHPAYTSVWEHQIVNDGFQNGMLLDTELMENAEGQPCILYCAYDFQLDSKRLYFAVRREP